MESNIRPVVCCVCNHRSKRQPLNVKKTNTGNYEALSPPNDFQLFNFSGDFRAAQTLTFDFLSLPIQ